MSTMSKYAQTSVCASCHVQYECLNTALSTPYMHDHGYWAGTSGAGRETLRRGEGKIPPRRSWEVTDAATPEQAYAAQRHAADGRSVVWISYARRSRPGLRRPCVVCGRPVWVWLRRVCLDCLADPDAPVEEWTRRRG